MLAFVPLEAYPDLIDLICFVFIGSSTEILYDPALGLHSKELPPGNQRMMNQNVTKNNGSAEPCLGVSYRGSTPH